METDLFPANLSDIEYSVIMSDIIKRFDCSMVKIIQFNFKTEQLLHTYEGGLRYACSVILAHQIGFSTVFTHLSIFLEYPVQTCVKDKKRTATC